MNRKFFALVLSFGLLGFLTLTAQAQEGKVGVVDKYDWGTIAPGSLEADIEIKNIGDGQLNIEKVQPSCGCTLLSPLEKNMLEPGESTTIHLSLNASRRNGPISKRLTIYSDDPNNPTKSVELVANIQAEVSPNPDTEK